MTDRAINFSAGPAALPESALEAARDELLSYDGTGMSVMEISHRSHWADRIFEEVEANVRRLLAVPDGYRILLLQGGAQLQFSMIPMNFLSPGQRADYVLTGSWGAKAIQEARKEGEAHVAWSGEEDGYVRAPSDHELDLADDAAYTYFTSNETIQGVQFQREPGAPSPLVCDASSDFLSRPLDLRAYDLLYACAQKNAGPAGLTVVVVSDRLIERRKRGLHSMLDYGRHAEAGSRLNTPPMFAIYMFLLITRWLESEFGSLESLAEHNRRKAELLYEVIDRHPELYRGHADPGSRSVMNVAFRLPTPELDAEFLRGAEERGMLQLKGHRSVGGIRASIYNAMPVAGVEALRDYMVEFLGKHR